MAILNNAILGIGVSFFGQLVLHLRWKLELILLRIIKERRCLKEMRS